MLKRMLYISRILIRNMLGKRTNTYCHWLWDSVFIDGEGDVSCCCNYGIGVIGNIYKRDLAGILKRSIRLRLFRWLSIKGCLRCFERCYHLSLAEKVNAASYTSPKEYPIRLLHIEYGTFCNASCTMCIQDHGSKITLDIDVLKKNINWEEIKDVALQGGEVLAIQSAKDFYLWLTQKNNRKVKLITNGLLIDDEWADYLIKGSKWIRISVNAATEKMYEFVNNNKGFYKAVYSIEKLIALNHKYGTDVEVRYHFCIIPVNVIEIPDAIQLADKLGCGMITFSYDYTMPAFFKRYESIREQTKQRISDLITDGNLKIKINGQFLEHLGLLDNSAGHGIICYDDL